jgi:Fic family protein
MPKTNNKDVQSLSTHIGIRINRDIKQEYEEYLKTFTDSSGKPRFNKISSFIKFLIDGFINETIIEIKDKKELELSTERTRDIIREELKEVKLGFQNLISTFTAYQLEKPEKKPLTYKIFELLGGEVLSLTSSEISKRLKVKEVEVLKALNELVETNSIKVSKNGKYEVEYAE